MVAQKDIMKVSEKVDQMELEAVVQKDLRTAHEMDKSQELQWVDMLEAVWEVHLVDKMDV